MKKIKSLYINGLGLKEIPDCVYCLENLENLELAINYIEQIPDKIKLLQNLTLLNIGVNINLKRLPIELIKLPKLKKMLIFLTSIDFLPEEIAESSIEKLGYDIRMSETGSILLSSPTRFTFIFRNKETTEKLKKEHTFTNIPPEISAKGLDAIKEYFKQKRAN